MKRSFVLALSIFIFYSPALFANQRACAEQLRIFNSDYARNHVKFFVKHQVHHKVLRGICNQDTYKANWPAISFATYNAQKFAFLNECGETNELPNKTCTEQAEEARDYLISVGLLSRSPIQPSSSVTMPSTGGFVQAGYEDRKPRAIKPPEVPQLFFCCAIGSGGICEPSPDTCGAGNSNNRLAKDKRGSPIYRSDEEHLRLATEFCSKEDFNQAFCYDRGRPIISTQTPQQPFGRQRTPGQASP